MVKKRTLYRIVMAVVFFALLEPSAFSGTWIHEICGYIRVMSFLVSIPTYFLFKCYKNKFANIALIFYVAIGAATILYSGKLSSDYIFLMRSVVAAIIFSGILYRRDPIGICKVMAWMLSVFLLFDAMTWVLPGLGYQYGASIKCFLGTKTTITYYFIPAMIFDGVYYRICPHREKKIAEILVLLAFVSTVVYLLQMPISTTIISVALYVFYAVVQRWKFHVVEWICKYGFIVSTVICVLFLFGTSIGVFEYIITNVLGESGDISGRRQIWDMVFLYISQRPLLGYGLGTGIYFDVWQATNASAHNLFLGMIIRSGFLGISLYGLMIWYIHTHNKIHDFVNGNIAQIVLFGFVVMNIAGISEDYSITVVTYCAWLLMGSTEYLSEQL